VVPGRPQPTNGTIIGVAVVLFGAVLLGVGMHHVVSTGTCSSTGYSSNLGPVPHCPKGTGWWILFIIGGVFLAVIGGLLSAGSTAVLIIPAIFGGIGIGALTVAFQGHPSSSTKTFALIFGGAFAVTALIPPLFIVFGAIRKLGRSARAPSPLGTRAPRPASAFGGAGQPDAILGAYAAGSTAGGSALGGPTVAGPTVATPPAAPGSLFAPPSTAFASASSSSASSPSTPSAHARRPAEDAIDKIARLAELHKSGALTDDEFSREKAKLLGEL
jgi:Short C-terminal domain